MLAAQLRKLAEELNREDYKGKNRLSPDTTPLPVTYHTETEHDPNWEWVHFWTHIDQQEDVFNKGEI
jgi:hypothetical protein